VNTPNEAERLRLIVDSLPVMAVACDGGLRCAFANRGYAEFFGLTPESIVGKHLREIIGERAYREIEHHLERALAGERTSYQGTRVVAGGEERHIEVDVVPHPGEDGTSRGLLAIVIDVTERRRADDLLRASEEKFSKAFHASPDWIALSTLHTGEFLEVNEGFERISGYSREESLGHSALDLGIWPHPEQRARLVEKLLRDEVVREEEAVFRHKNGEERFVQLSMEAMELGGEPCVLTVGHDVTERRREQQLRDLGHSVTELIASAASTAAAVQAMIRAICTAERWDCGRYFVPSENGLRVAHSWGIDDPEIQAYLERWKSRELPNTSSLIGTVWHSARPLWVPEMAKDPRVLMMMYPPDLAAGGAFIFPVRSDGAVIGVLIFNSRERRAPDQPLLQIILGLGSQIGQFLQRKHAEERAHYLAHFDELTDLPNRTTFNERLEHALARARRTHERLAILFVDLDRFKNINDTLGHAAGDVVLEEIARRMRECVRECDTISRLGGDEFLVLLEEASEPATVTAVAQRLLAAVSRPVRVESQEFHLSASIGISTFPDDSDDAQSLVKHADIAMYRAKELGKNTHQFYSAEINRHTLARVALESDLRRALERDELVLHYQPKVAIDGMRIVGMEALVRWQPPGKAQVAPADFIPLAEETGLIVPIGEWVLKTACRQNRALQELGLAPLRVAVNLSRRQFTHRSLVEDVARALETTGLDPAFLELEITESMVMGDPDGAVRVLRGLKSMGIHLSIDDFGTGYSSLSYLKRFPLDTVKIDQSFIQDLPGDGDDVVITQAIIAMAHSLRLDVVAEGVETAEQLAFLRENGCDEMQGYHFSRPLPADRFLELLRGGPALAALEA